ncbi:MAG: ABC transporter substrate-binding protein [Gammaproteobacteria bacterium]
MCKRIAIILTVLAGILLAACGDAPLNNPYPAEQDGQTILYSSFSERPKHLDPAIAYSSNEYGFIAQIYEPPLQYHYLRRPYTLVPLTAEALPEVQYFDAQGRRLAADADSAAIAYSDYVISVKPGILYQPHPAFAADKDGAYLYHHLSDAQLDAIDTLDDFQKTATRDLTAEDYIFQIKRLAHPSVQSPIAELMKQYIVGFEAFAQAAANVDTHKLGDLALEGAVSLDRYRYRIRIKGKYPQFKYWLAMPFFAPVPWEAAVFYAQPGLIEKNITLDWYPVGTGAYFMQENNPNRRITLAKNPHFHGESYPADGAPGDARQGLLHDAGKPLPMIEKIVYMLEKENIPYWNKFLQGYYDMSGVVSDSFDQAVQFTGRGGVELTPAMQEKGISLKTSVPPSIFYTGFNMRDPVIGGLDEKRRKLRQAIAIAVDIEEEISIFMNGRGIPAQGLLPPGIYGYEDGQAGIDPYVYDWVDGKPRRKNIAAAQRLLAEAGYPGGRDPKSGESLVLYYDTAGSGPDDRSTLNWYRKQFAKLGIQLVIRATDYNRFQQKMRDGNAQIYSWGWNADYPDPENFFFLLYGPNAKVDSGGENASNYQNPEYDRLFEQMRNMDDGPQRLRLIRQMQDILRRDAPWLFGLHPKSFALIQSWYGNVKRNSMANNTLKYQKLDVAARSAKRMQWNQPVFWPLGVLAAVLMAVLWPAVRAYRQRGRAVV